MADRRETQAPVRTIKNFCRYDLVHVVAAVVAVVLINLLLVIVVTVWIAIDGTI